MRKNWNIKEIQFIKAMYFFMTCQEMANRLNRSYDSVKHKLQSMGIYLPDSIKQSRSMSNLKIGNGNENPNWKGGRSKDNYFYKKRMVEKYPEKDKARKIVHEAIRNGKLTRKPCEVCGDHESHAHHEDYTKPLQIIWLCRKHHNAVHSL